MFEHGDKVIFSYIVPKGKGTVKGYGRVLYSTDTTSTVLVMKAYNLKVGELDFKKPIEINNSFLIKVPLNSTSHPKRNKKNPQEIIKKETSVFPNESITYIVGYRLNRVTNIWYKPKDFVETP